MFSRDKLKLGQNKEDSGSLGQMTLPPIGGKKLQPNGRGKINLNIKNQFQKQQENGKGADDSGSKSSVSESNDDEAGNQKKTPIINKNGAKNMNPLQALLKSAGAQNEENGATGQGKEEGGAGGRGDVKNQFQKNLLTALKKKQHQKTINAIIKRSMTQKYEAEPEKVQEEYVPTMKDKFMKHKMNIRCMIHHNDNFRVRWDIFVMALALWNCLSIPFDVAFEPEIPKEYEIFEYFVDTCFIIDIFVAFRTTFINEKTGFEVVEGHRIAWNYIISGRFFVDLAASIPFEQLYWLFLAAEGHNHEPQDDSHNLELKLFGVLKLVRLLRLGRILRYLKFKQGLKIGLRMVELLFFLLMLVHWIACSWYFLIREKKSWVPPRDLDYTSRQDNELWKRKDFYEEDIHFKYVTVFYYAILSMVGNEISPRDYTQIVVSSLIIITGAIVTAFIFGNMAALMATMNKKNTMFDEQLDLVNTTMRRMKLDESMMDKVVDYMRYIQNSPDIQQAQDLDVFFQILNDPLKKQILYHIHSSLLKNVDFFQKCSSVEQCFFICRLKSVLFLPEDYIVKEGEKGDNIYFIHKGEVSVSMLQAIVNDKSKSEKTNDPSQKQKSPNSDEVNSIQNRKDFDDEHSKKKKKGNDSLSFEVNNSIELHEGGGKYSKSHESSLCTDSVSESLSKEKSSSSSQESDSDSCFEEEIFENKTIRYLKEGSIFGEVALLTKLKRTATIQSEGNCTCAYLCQSDVETLKENFPHIVKEFLQKILKDYNDQHMVFRQKMIRNLHYLKTLNDDIINEIICKLESKRYAKGQIILKNGDVSNHLMFVRSGLVDIKVTTRISEDVEATKENELFFDVLNTGSCFCAYSFMCDDAQLLQKFQARTVCVIESISRDDFFQIAKKYYQLADKLDIIRKQFQQDETDFDFFRYKQPRNFPEATKKMIREKFRVALKRWIRKYRNNEVDIPPALKILKEFQRNRADMHAEIKRMRDDYTMSLLIGEGFQGDEQQANQQEKGKEGNQGKPKPEATQQQDDKSSGDDQGEEDKESNGDDKMELQNLMKNLQHFASLSATVPDAKYSKTRERNLMKDLQEELNDQNKNLEQQLQLAQNTLEVQQQQIQQIVKQYQNMSNSFNGDQTQPSKNLRGFK